MGKTKKILRRTKKILRNLRKYWKRKENIGKVKEIWENDHKKKPSSVKSFLHLAGIIFQLKNRAETDMKGETLNKTGNSKKTPKSVFGGWSRGSKTIVKRAFVSCLCERSRAFCDVSCAQERKKHTFCDVFHSNDRRFSIFLKTEKIRITCKKNKWI